MRMWMWHGNSFFTQSFVEKPRGENGFAVPNMEMLDVGSSLGNRHYINLDLMATLERWTFPANGYPLLLQVGEERSNGEPFLDAQHPHSSPLMGLTLSDTIAIGSGQDHLKFWFAPRGESGDGPVAFMHRPTGSVNPDAPLGHHIGQDVGHISSTVLGARVHLSDFTWDLSTFNGTEPEPTEVDLPMATPNSYSTRLAYQLTPSSYAMGSLAYVKNPEPHALESTHLWRYSISVYNDADLSGGWTIHNALIWGLINGYDEASALNSFAEEFLWQRNAMNFWGRIEVLQRTPLELEIGPETKGRWLTAATLGYTHRLQQIGPATLSLGGSFSKDFLPAEYQKAYAGNPVTARLFLQLSGHDMGSF